MLIIHFVSMPKSAFAGAGLRAVSHPWVPWLSVMSSANCWWSWTWLASDIIWWSCYLCEILSNNWAWLHEVYWKCKYLKCCLTLCGSHQPPYIDHLWYWKNYLKWWAIQLLTHCRVHTMNNYRFMENCMQEAPCIVEINMWPNFGKPTIYTQVK